MARLFVSQSPAQLSDQDLAEHASKLSGFITGYRVVALITALLAGGMAYFSESDGRYFLFASGVAIGFYIAQSRLAVLAERIKRLENQLQDS